MVKKWRVFLGSSCMSRPEPGNAVYIIYGYYPGLRSPHRVFLRSLRENRSFFEKKRKPCLSPHARGFLFYVLILYGVRVFEILRFFMKTPGWVMHGFRRYTLNVLMYSYLWFFLGFFIFLEEKSEICEDQAAMHIAKPFFPKRAFSFIYLAKTEGLWSRKVKTLSGSKAPPFYWEIWAQKPFLRKKGFAICIGFQSFLLRGKLWILENCKVFKLSQISEFYDFFQKKWFFQNFFSKIFFKNF